MLSYFLFKISREDLRSRIIPDEYCIGICILAVGMGGFGVDTLCMALAVLIASSFFMGLGDAKLLGALTLLLKLRIFPVIFCSFMTASLYCIVMLLRRELSLGDSIPFAPFIAAPALCVFLTGNVL